MPPSNTTLSRPSHTHPAPSPTATADSASGTHQTAIIIGVSVGVGCLVLLVAGYKLWMCFTQRSKSPLPPRGPLAHDRQHQMTSAHARSGLNHPHSMEVPSHGLAYFSNTAQHDDHIRQISDDSSNPPSSPSIVSSQVHLVQTPTGSDENGEAPRPRLPSFSGTSTARRYSHGPRKRTLSASGSLHSNRSRQSVGGSIRGRGPPHARHSRVDIVLPQPLAPELYYRNSTRQSQLLSHPGVSSYERQSEYWEDSPTSMGDHASPCIEPYTHQPEQYPPPVPPLPVSMVPLPALLPMSGVPSPTSADPLTSQLSASPERGSPLFPPRKDSP